MKKYILPALFTLIVVGIIVFAVRAATNPANDAKPEDTQSPSVALSEEDKAALKEGQIYGSSDKKIVLTEFADFQCPACKFYEKTVEELRNTYKDQLTVVFKHYPLYPSPHKNAQVAAYASEAAAKQGKFWEMHDKLFETQDDWSELDDPKETYITYASGIGLNVDQFKSDYDNKAGEGDIRRDKDFGTRLKLKGTPTFYLDGKLLDLKGDPSALKKAVEDAIKAAQ
ncbi:DsbA family protein [bacterium]|nr:DsbA family protein [bacterium]